MEIRPDSKIAASSASSRRIAQTHESERDNCILIVWIPFWHSLYLRKIENDDSLISKKEFFARVDQARKDIAEGKGLEVNGKEALTSLLESI